MGIVNTIERSSGACDAKRRAISVQQLSLLMCLTVNWWCVMVIRRRTRDKSAGREFD